MKTNYLAPIFIVLLTLTFIVPMVSVSPDHIEDDLSTQTLIVAPSGDTTVQSQTQTLTIEVTQITETHVFRSHPAIYGDYIVWIEGIVDDWDIVVHDLNAPSTTPITTDDNQQFHPAIYGDIIVWEDWSDNKIHMYDLSTPTGDIPIDPIEGIQSRPAIYEDRVVWTDNRMSPFGIYVYDLSSSSGRTITTSTKIQYRADIYEDIVVWEDHTDSPWDIVGYNLSTDTPITITADDENQLSPKIHGNYVVYEGQFSFDPLRGNVWLYDLSTGIETQITSNEARQGSPAIYGDRIVWTDSRNGLSEVYLYDLSLGVEVFVGRGGAPEIHENRIVWTDGIHIYLGVIIEPSNLPPEIISISGPLGPAAFGTDVEMFGKFTDPDIVDTHTAIWDWGDGVASAGTVEQTERTVTGSHVFETSGVYTVTLTVTDSYGESDTMTWSQYCVIYDPSAGFVTGGGWIDSPAGAYREDPSLTGKANFGFVSKYKKGAEVPTGSTEFQFKVGDLNFHSDAYDWLVIAGAKAIFKGTGTINGEGSYKFMVTAWDGDLIGGPDKFRIKIWTENEETSEEIVIYDNGEQGTEIGGGSIKIHKGEPP